MSDYNPLRDILDAAYSQASAGKGQERHANGRPFQEQPIMRIQEMVGPSFATGQAIKKIQESERMDADAAERELLGAIVYLAGAILHKRGAAGSGCGRMMRVDWAEPSLDDKMDAAAYMWPFGPSHKDMVAGAASRRAGKTFPYPWGGPGALSDLNDHETLHTLRDEAADMEKVNEALKPKPHPKDDLVIFCGGEPMRYKDARAKCPEFFDTEGNLLLDMVNISPSSPWKPRPTGD